MNSSLNIGRKWDFEQLEAWYTALLNPGGKHKYYDAELHYLTVKSLLSIIDKSPSTKPFDKLSAESLESAFTSPDSLAEALINLDLSQLINGYWPNDNSGSRYIPVSMDQWLQNSEVDLPEDDDGLRIDDRVYIGEEWYIPPIIGYTPDDFLAKSFDLIERETSKDGLSVWPLSLLLVSGTFREPWVAWGDQVHETDDKYPIYSFDLFMEMLKKCFEKDDSDWRPISQYSYQMKKSALEFSEGQRVSGYATLATSFDIFSNNEWALGFLDHQIQSSSLKRSDLDIDEWLQMFKLSVVSLENAPTTNESYGILSPDSSRGLDCPVIAEDYWAWRTGWVIASGLHLKDQIMDLAFRKNYLSYPAEEPTIDLITTVPISIAIDLLATSKSGTLS
jgi:hypothetical protein